VIAREVTDGGARSLFPCVKGGAQWLSVKVSPLHVYSNVPHWLPRTGLQARQLGHARLWHAVILETVIRILHCTFPSYY